MRTKLLRPLTAFAALFLLSLTGCGPKPAKTTGTKPKILHLGNGAEPQDLDPQTVTGMPEHKLLTALFEGLVSEDPKDLHPEPGLASSWDISPDHLVYTFHLRPGLRWSNGDPLNAHDFIRSYQRILSPELASEYSYLLWYVVGAEEFNKGQLKDFSQVGFKAVDDLTLQITLKNPTPWLLQLMASHYTWKPVPTQVIEKFGPINRSRTNWTRAGNHVGSGPYMLKEWLPQQKIIVVRNPHYWDAQTVKVDEIHFYPTEDLNTEERMFRTGQLHMTYELPSAKIEVYRKEYPESLRIDPYLGVYFYRCNVTRPPLNDKRVRRALALSIDRESLVRNVVRGGQEASYAISYPGTAGYTPRARLHEDLAEARRLLAEAGYPDGKGLPPIELQYNTQDNHRAIAETLQQMWRQNLGAEVVLRNLEWKVYIDAEHRSDFTLSRGGWIADYIDPDVFLSIWITGNTNNNTLWSNATYDQLYLDSLKAPNNASRYEIYQKMDALLLEEMPVIPLYNYKKIYALSPKVKGWYPTLLDSHPYKYLDLEE